MIIFASDVTTVEEFGKGRTIIFWVGENAKFLKKQFAKAKKFK